MKTSTMTKTLGLLALLGSSASMASTITITASTLTPLVGSNFTMTISSDVQNTFGAATLRLAFDASKVVYASGAALAPFNFYSKVSANNATPTDFYVEAPVTPVGAYNVAVLTFTALAAGAANIKIDDDDCATGSFGWPDTVGGCVGGISYVQAPVVVTQQVVPVPAAAWLFVSALGGLATLRRRTQQA